MKVLNTMEMDQVAGGGKNSPDIIDIASVGIGMGTMHNLGYGLLATYYASAFKAPLYVSMPVCLVADIAGAYIAYQIGKYAKANGYI